MNNSTAKPIVWPQGLIEQGVKRGDTVALFVERSIPMLVGLLAVLKVGAAYVPQDARIVPPCNWPWSSSH